MIITPFEELERQAREEYRKRFSSLPKPKVINATASVSLDAPRCFLWGGLTFWVPPLGYEDGLRLFVAAQALAETDDAVPTTARLIWRVTKPTLKARLIHARKGNPFLNANAGELETLVNWLLHVPDEAGVVPSSKPVTFDLLDSRYAFEDAYKRPPRSWADYVSGLHHIARKSAREDLRLACAVRIAMHADKDGWKDYESDTRAAAGWA